ncbi:MAG: GxxExxY protein [Salinivirgaceae bacterium]|jgi:GxxExxY protein|nr:GxxExxY protein [Salinivirgaceae bacterium]
MVDLIYKEEVYKIIGAAMEVHKELGCGFLEAVYQEALSLEFEEQKITFEQEKVIEIYYKDLLLNKKYKADFLCYGKIIIEIKALSSLNSDHENQLLNYLKATEEKVGLLINFGTKSLQYKRMVL